MKYFIIENEQQTGPFTLEELQQKGIKSDTLVWAEGMADWTPAWQVEELKALLFGPGQVQPPPYTPKKPNDDSPQTPPPASEAEPPVQPARAVQPEQPAPRKAKKRGRGCMAGITTLVVLAAVAVLMALTCPDKEAHRKAIEEKVATSLEAAAPTHNSLFEMGFKMFKKFLDIDNENDEMEDMLDQLLDFHNYLVVSRMTVDMGGKAETVSWGALGKVFTVNTDDLAANMAPAQQTGAATQSAAPSGEALSPQEDEGGEGIGSSNSGDVLVDIGDEAIRSIGNILKKQMVAHTDSTTASAWGKIIDGMTDIIKKNAQ